MNENTIKSPASNVLTPGERRILINQRSIMLALRTLVGDSKGTPAIVIQALREDGDATLDLLKRK
jgi:hypothetical protein